MHMATDGLMGWRWHAAKQEPRLLHLPGRLPPCSPTLWKQQHFWQKRCRRPSSRTLVAFECAGQTRFLRTLSAHSTAQHSTVQKQVGG